MKRIMVKRETIGFLAVYALVTLVAITINFDLVASGLLFTQTPASLIASFGESDAGNYLRLALDLSNFQVAENNRWILGLWPPGMPALFALILLSGLPIGVGVLLITSLVTSVPIYLILKISKQSASPFIGYLVALAFLVEPNRVWALSQGLYNSDGLGSTLLTSSILVLFLAKPTHRTESGLRGFILSKYFVAGSLLSASLYFRWAYAPVVAFAFMASVGAYFLGRFILRNDFDSYKRKIRQFTASFVVFLSPWTLFAGFVLHPGNFAWSMGDYQWAQRWWTDAELESRAAHWLVQGGANWACHIDAIRCSLLQPFVETETTENFTYLRNEALNTAISHPIELFLFKWPIVWDAFLTQPGSEVGSNGNTLWGVIAASVFVFSIVLVLISRQKSKNLIPLLTIVILVGVLGLAHLEARYLLPVWDIIFGVSLLQASILFRVRWPNRVECESPSNGSNKNEK